MKKLIKDLKAGVSHRILSSKYDCLLGTLSNVRKIYAENMAKNKAERKLKLTDTIKRDVILSIKAKVDNSVQVKNKLNSLNKIEMNDKGVRRTLK